MGCVSYGGCIGGTPLACLIAEKPALDSLHDGNAYTAANNGMKTESMIDDETEHVGDTG